MSRAITKHCPGRQLLSLHNVCSPVNGTDPGPLISAGRRKAFSQGILAGEAPKARCDGDTRLVQITAASLVRVTTFGSFHISSQKTHSRLRQTGSRSRALIPGLVEIVKRCLMSDGYGSAKLWLNKIETLKERNAKPMWRFIFGNLVVVRNVDTHLSVIYAFALDPITLGIHQEAEMAPPVKGAGILLRLYTPTGTSPLEANCPLDVPGAVVTSITTLSSTDDKVSSGSPPASLVYEVKHISRLLLPGAYEADAEKTEASTTTLSWQVYKLLAKRSRPGLEGVPQPKGAVVVCVGITPGDDAVDEYAKWYEEEHLELISLVPGWRQSVRYELAKAFGGPNVVAPYLAVHFYDEVNGLGGPEWLKSVGTDWTKAVREKCVVPHFRRVWKVKEQKLLGS